GIVVNYFFNSGISADEKQQTRLSNAYTNFQYSVLNQLVLEGVYSIYTNKEKYILQGSIGYKKFYERYWTFSEDTVGNNNFRGINYKHIYLRGKLIQNLKNQIFVGVTYSYNRFNNITFQEGVYPQIPKAAGLGESMSLGIGPTVVIDKRDNQFSPQKGWFAEVGYRIHDKNIGSNFNYSQLNIDLRNYIVTKPKGILALNIITVFNSGTVPFLEKAKLGNDKIMRGYFAGRFRDDQFAAAQMEYRYPIGKIFILAGFLSAGQTAPNVSAFALNTMQSSIGGGLRYLVNKQKHLYVRFDAGYTQKQNWGFYLNLGDAF
ncbi:MAG: BamA/TamA family outer membrane protein, partial [Deinococcales bacterium]|nr:BamA/TamA family outer membrane protein [Chitinophagaceae bacterium]